MGREQADQPRFLRVAQANSAGGTHRRRTDVGIETREGASAQGWLRGRPEVWPEGLPLLAGGAGRCWPLLATCWEVELWRDLELRRVLLARRGDFHILDASPRARRQEWANLHQPVVC